MFCIYSTAPPEHSLSRCSETAGRVKKGLGFGMWIRSGYKKPQSTSAHCRSLRCSAVASLFEPCSRLEPLRVSRLPHAPSLSVLALLKPASSARTSFLLDAFTTYTNGWIGRGTGVSPREDNLVGLVASLQSRQGYRLAVHTLAALPPGLPGQASELYYEKIR